MSDIFETPSEPNQGTEGTEQTYTSPNQEGYLQKLVETKGEHWKDPEVLAKGKFEADRYIEELKRQVDEMREDIGKQDYSKQLLEQLQQQATQPQGNAGQSNKNTNPEGAGGTTEDTKTKDQMSEDVVKSLVERTLTERERQNTAQQNLSQVDQSLRESFGTEAQAHVQKKAQELGLSVERLKGLAEESPSAFLSLVGGKPPVPTTVHQGSVRTESAQFNAPSEKNFQHYQELRRKNKSQYYSAETQRQMMKDRERLGDRFYS